MEEIKKRKQSFLLRLPISIREKATEIAHEDGVSLNHFVSLAVAEKLSRMDEAAHQHVHRAPTHATTQNPMRLSRVS